jgi:hypothetical protein
MPSFEVFNDIIPPELSLENSRLPKGFLLALLVENFQITFGYLSL